MGTLYTIYIYIYTYIYILCSYRLEYYVIWFLNISHVGHMETTIYGPNDFRRNVLCFEFEESLKTLPR